MFTIQLRVETFIHCRHLCIHARIVYNVLLMSFFFRRENGFFSELKAATAAASLQSFIYSLFHGDSQATYEMISEWTFQVVSKTELLFFVRRKI